MTRITRVLAVPATGAYYAIDLVALQANPIPVAEQYTTPAETRGFRRVREVAEAVSVGLVLSDDLAGSGGGEVVVWGDCVGVAYAGISGRDPVFRAADALRTIRREVEPLLEGREVTTFREMASKIDALTQEVRVPAQAPQEPDDDTPSRAEGLSRRDLLTAPFRALRPDGIRDESTRRAAAEPSKLVTVQRPLHTGIRYGVSQALLKAVARARHLSMAEVIADEWDLPYPEQPVPIHAQSGADRRKNADKMILRRVSSLPHALIEDTPNQLGEDGEVLVRYVRWLKERIRELGGSDYRPTIHLDMHGALGRVYENNLGRVLGYLHRLESSVQPLKLRIESPLVMESRDAQIETLSTLRDYVQFRNMAVEIVADEWADTLEDIHAFIDAQAVDVIQIKMPDLGGLHDAVEAVLACKEAGIGAFLGGSCAETDLSARAAAHLALAARPALIMARPGMGVDEAISIVQNEMTRTLALLSDRHSP